MTVETVIVNNMNFKVVTESVVCINVSRYLYDVLEVVNEEGKYCNLHTNSRHISMLLEDIEENELDEYEGAVTEEDIELLRACKVLLDTRKTDVINFIKE